MLANSALECHIQNTAGEQGSLDGVGGLSGAEEVFDAENERVEEAAPGGAGRYIKVETVVSAPFESSIVAAKVVSST